MHEELLDLYADYLISSFRATTATGLSQLVAGAVSQDQGTRFLAAKARTSSDLWRLVAAGGGWSGRWCAKCRHLWECALWTLH